MKTIRSILLALVGIACLVSGMQIYNTEPGDGAHIYEYGGDAFTGIQNTEAHTANLVRLQSTIISHGMGSIMIFGGITLIVCAIPTNLKKKED